LVNDRWYGLWCRKAYYWVKSFTSELSSIKGTVEKVTNNNAAHIQDGIQTINETMNNQTTAIVTELRELRQDIRSLRKII
jgi:hypothetical protein